MFEPTNKPRLFAFPVGADFPRAIVEGLTERLAGTPPEALARVTIFVNTTRMRRRLHALFAQRGALLLPRIRLITELADDPTVDLPPAESGLSRRLELAQLVRKLIEADPTLAAPHAAYDLADSLAAMLEETQSEGVTFDNLAGISVAQHSAHWARSQRFLGLVRGFLEPDTALDEEGRQRGVVDALARRWRASPPTDPILIAGSTGSRGTTRAFMRAVARLPQGAVLLPGFDTDLPADGWAQLRDEGGSPDHPQYRYLTLMDELEIAPADIPLWPQAMPANEGRGALVSLALRPAPVTNAWLEEGPQLPALSHATQALTLVEAPNPRFEVLAIALRLRKAAEEGIKAALITPDQSLSRQVTAALSAWQIIPDDSAGMRLDLTAPGRLLRQTAALIGEAVTPDKLLALLKHPLVSGDTRGAHLARTRAMELDLLRGGPPVLTRADTQRWMAKREVQDPDIVAWLDWLWACLDALQTAPTGHLSARIAPHIAVTERLTRGPDDGTPHLWLRKAGEAAQKLMSDLQDAAAVAGPYSPAEYNALLAALLRREEVRDPYAAHPDIMIWGTLEARVQGAELVILGGLNDGTWPALPDPDPWLNRDMRKQAGMRLPDALIGLSAHDFQQGIAAPEVWLTRAVRDAEAETVPSRWLNRLCNLLGGLPGEGVESLKAMRARGAEWLGHARRYDKPATAVAPAPRPSPQPPVTARPNSLSVTQIETLIRDPYAIYARHVLRLKPLKPLFAEADAALRGEVVHRVMQAFIAAHKTAMPPDAEQQLYQTAAGIIARDIPWPATRSFWLSRFARVVPWLIQTEQARRHRATPFALEADGIRRSTATGFTLKGRADRVDRDESGALVLYDYKTGLLPSEDVQKHFNKQLLLLAAIGAASGYEGFTSQHVKAVGFIGLGSTPKEDLTETTMGDIDRFWASFEGLIARYMDPEKGYPSRRAVFESRWDQDYDLLARWGEWDPTQSPRLIPVTPEAAP